MQLEGLNGCKDATMTYKRLISKLAGKNVVRYNIEKSAGQIPKNVRLFDSVVGLLIQLKDERLSNGQLQDPS